MRVFGNYFVYMRVHVNSFAIQQKCRLKKKIPIGFVSKFDAQIRINNELPDHKLVLLSLKAP